jgi:radical SAM protein with 4Fe4S-binding SPASM domain
VLQKKFSKVYIEISNICNLQCSFCPEVLRTKGLMDVELFRHIMAQVAPLTEQVAFHLMGDPLVHPKLNQFVAICAELGAQIYLVTNGVLLRAKHSQMLLSSAFRQINFSLHSFPDNFGEQDPTPYLERIFRFVDQAFVLRPDLYINFRLWNLSAPKGQEAKNLAIFNKIQEHYGVSLPAEVDVRLRKSIHITNRLYLHFDTEFVWPSLDLPVLGTRGRCYGLSSHFGILMDGTVVPCCLDKEGKIPLGNVKERSVVDILADERAQLILQGFRERKLRESLCQRCQYIERFK